MRANLQIPSGDEGSEISMVVFLTFMILWSESVSDNFASDGPRVVTPL